MKFLTGSIIFTAILSAADAIAEPVSPFLDASWAGTGVFRETTDGPVQNGRCRVETVVTLGQEALNLTGQCAGVAASTKVLLKLERRGENRIAAVFRLWAWDREIQFVGVESDGVIRMTGREPMQLNGSAFDSALEINWSQGPGFSMEFAVSTGSGPDVELLSMQFELR